MAGDFLTRLVTRTLHPGAGIRPRRAVPFASGLDSPTREAPIAGEQGPSSQVRAPLARAGAAEPLTGTTAPTAEDVSRTRRVGSPGTGPTERAGSPDDRERRPAPAPPERPPAIPGARQPRALEPPRTPAPREDTEVTAASQDGLGDAASAAAPLPVPAAAGVRTLRSLLPGRPTPPESGWPTSPARHGEPSPPAPTVRVDIGRVEIRATPPAPPRRRESRLMSLADYLERRPGSRR